MDSIVVAPGAVGELSTRAAVSGNHIYRATTPTRVANGRGMAGVLTGAMVVVVALSPISDRAVAGGRDSLAVECSRRS